MQAVVTTAEHNVLLQQLAVVTSTKTKANPQVLKGTPVGKNKGAVGKGKIARPVIKGKVNIKKPTSSPTSTSASSTANTRAKTKDSPVVTVTMLQDLMDELQAIEQESPDDDNNSEITQGSDLEEEDSESNLTETEEQ